MFSMHKSDDRFNPTVIRLDHHISHHSAYLVNPLVFSTILTFGPAVSLALEPK